jgi:Ser/Thr protein kinase RdoA (MazF antagonist)
VIKPVQDFNPGEGDWIAEMLDGIIEDGFRVIKPVRAADGRWLEDGWTAWRWIEGEHRRRGWEEIIDSARAFHRAVPAAIAQARLETRPAWLDTRGHRWALSEATVWHGAPRPSIVNDGQLENSLFERAMRLALPLPEADRAGCQVVHGDIAGNVLALADGSGVAFIDVSPGWRTPESVAAQIAVEAVAWFKGDPVLLAPFGQQDLARACAFRLLCGLQFSADWAADYPGEVATWSRVLDLIGA